MLHKIMTTQCIGLQLSSVISEREHIQKRAHNRRPLHTRDCRHVTTAFGELSLSRKGGDLRSSLHTRRRWPKNPKK